MTVPLAKYSCLHGAICHQEQLGRVTPSLKASCRTLNFSHMFTIAS